MKEQVSMLVELQEIMTRGRALVDEKERIPLEVADLKGEYETKESARKAVETEFGKVRDDRAKKEVELDAERDKVEKAKTKLMAIKTNKEYFAMVKEIDQVKRANDQREEELAALNARFEEVEGRLAAVSSEADEVGGRYRERMIEIEARMAAFDGDIATVAAEKAAVAVKLSPQMVRRFEQVFDRRDGIAIVAAHDHACTGCHMNLSPQLYNIIQKKESMQTCPNCNRFLYYDGEPMVSVAEPEGGAE